VIGERLQEVRKDHGDTQEALARKMNVSKSTVQSWEQEKSSPSHEALIALCRLYGVSSDYLLGLSNVDPVYEKKQREALPEDIALQLRDYQAYLVWKREQTK